MSNLQPLVGKEGVIVGDYRWVSGGVMRQENEYLAPNNRREETLRWMSQDGFSEMATYLRSNLGRLSEFDRLAWVLLMDDDKRREVANEMMKYIPGWGGWLPVMDRNGEETMMVEIDEGEAGLSYYILAGSSGGQESAWYRLKDLWPMVVYQNWRIHNQKTILNIEDDD